MKLALAVLATAAVFAQQPTFQVEVKLVRIVATVKNSTGQLVGDLNKEDFEVFDNGVRQNLAVFEHHTEQPLSVALMIDTSASTGIDLKEEIASIQRFLQALLREGNPRDSASLYAFNWQTDQLVDYTRRMDSFEHGLRRLKSEGGTSMYDAIGAVAGDLEERDGRHVMVLVTDGGDTTSVTDFHAALRAAQMADVVLYPVVVVPISNDPGRNVGGENALTMLAQGTAGRPFSLSGGAELDRAFAEILRELRTQYLLGYYPKDVPPSDDPYHRISVKLPRRPELRVSARSGYYGETRQKQGWKRP